MDESWFFFRKSKKPIKSGGSGDESDEMSERRNRPRIVDGRKKSPSRSSKTARESRRQKTNKSDRQRGSKDKRKRDFLEKN